MFAGSYWGKRPEAREQAAKRLNVFLTMLAECSAELASWFSKGRSRASALRKPVRVDVESIRDMLKVNRTDIGRQVIQDLGYSFSAWNGDHASLSAVIGVYSEHVQNAVVLSESPSQQRLDDEVWRCVLNAAIVAFEPELAIVAKRSSVVVQGPPRDRAWLVYDRANGVVEFPERR